MKKLIYLMVVGIMCAALAGCGKEEKKEPEKIETVEDLQEVIKDYQEQKEAEHQRQLEAEYPEGVLPVGKYVFEKYAELQDDRPKELFSSFTSNYYSNNGRKNISMSAWSTRNEISDSYQYDSETGECYFELYDPKGKLFFIFKGYYENDKFIMTYIESIESNTICNDIAWEWARE